MLARICKIMLLIGVTLISFSSFAGAQYQNGIPVLLYHHISDTPTDLPTLTTSVEEFERHLQLLQTNGFQTISTDELLTFMKGSTIGLPDKPIVITFDDGYEDNYTNAFPLLKKYNFRATLFMVGINVDREKRLSTPRLREMFAHGITIDAHSMTHPDLTSLTSSALQHEVYGSKEKLQSVTHKTVATFAYPSGLFNVAVAQSVELSGYQGAFTVLTGLNHPSRDNIYQLRRIPIYHTTDFDHLITLFNANKPKTSLLEY